MRSTVCPAGAPRPPSGCCADNVATRPSNVKINNDCLMRIFTSPDGPGRRFACGAAVKSPNSLSRYVREATAGDENRVELPGVADVVERIGFQHDEIGPLP